MTDIPERVASIEAKMEAHGKELEELVRQKTAMWERLDEIQAEVDAVKLEAAKDGARLETKLAEMDKTALREAFGMKTQIAEIGWRVGLIVGAAIMALNFILSKIDLSSFISDKKSTHRTNGR